jgi:hypothetical protein
MKKYDQRTYQCWAYCKDPSHIPQMVFLTLFHNEVKAYEDPQVRFVRPRGSKDVHVFKILIHLDVIEDLLFYHYPRDVLLADGKVSWRDFAWQYGRPNGDIEDEALIPPTRSCGQMATRRWHPRGDDDGDREQEQSRSQGFMCKVSSWLDGRGRNNSRATKGYHGSGQYRGDSSRNRSSSCRDLSLPPRVKSSLLLNRELLGNGGRKRVRKLIRRIQFRPVGLSAVLDPWISLLAS